MKQYLLFDLDGTLTDPKLGITSCVQYALREFGIEETDLDKLEPFIGPPLKDSFMEFYGLSEEQAHRAVEKYRERFQDTGIFENEIYDGIPHMLRLLKRRGFHLAVASSKPTVYVERILDHFKIADYFEAVVGSELDGSRTDKREVIQEALKRLAREGQIPSEQVYMIGDRKFDVEGAGACRAESVGAAYGYGGMEELKEAGADYIVRSVKELESFLLRETWTDGKARYGLQAVWRIIFPFISFFLIRQLAFDLLYLGVQTAVGGVLGGWPGLAVWDADGYFAGLTGNVVAVLSVLSFLLAALAVWQNGVWEIRLTEREMKFTHLKRLPAGSKWLLFVTAAGAVLGLNLLLELTGITGGSQSYRAVAAEQFSVSFPIGLLLYGLVSPVAEELLFRGVLYGRTRRIMDHRLAAGMTALLFGAYHMNLVQGLYGFLMGCLMCWAYEYFGRFRAPLAVHAISNILAFCLSFLPDRGTAFVSWPVCILSLASACFGLTVMNLRKR